MVDPVSCAIGDIPALTLIKQYLCNKHIKNLSRLENEVRPQWAFCSVDAGGEKIARLFANSFGTPLVIAHKQRDHSRLNTIESIRILSSEPVAGKILWIVDDMIDTAASVEKLIRTLAPLGPSEINLIAVHALFSPPASERIACLSQEGLLKRIIVTDTVCCSGSLCEQIPGIEIVPSAELSARIIRAIVTNASMAKLMRPFNASLYFNSPQLGNQ
jgi:ribose-phosphate pyrophosphokinase